MKKRVKRRNPIVAVAQIRYFDYGKKDNVSKIKKFIRLAKKKGADIVCFPETCVHENDFMSFSHKLIKEIKEECKKSSIWCIINDDMKRGLGTYNTAILINRDGKIVGEHRKIHLMGDNEKVKAGKRIKVFQTDFAKIGIAICWDLYSSRLFRKMKRKGAEIIFCPTSWRYEAQAYQPAIYDEKHRKKEFATLKSLVRTRAFENLFFVAICNPARGKEDKDLVSYSAICSPYKILKEIKDREGLIFEEIKINEIKKLEKLHKEAA